MLRWSFLWNILMSPSISWSDVAKYAPTWKLTTHVSLSTCDDLSWAHNTRDARVQIGHRRRNMSHSRMCRHYSPKGGFPRVIFGRISLEPSLHSGQTRSGLSSSTSYSGGCPTRGQHVWCFIPQWGKWYLRPAGQQTSTIHFLP